LNTEEWIVFSIVVLILAFLKDAGKHSQPEYYILATWRASNLQACNFHPTLRGPLGVQWCCCC
jgi:hypothetical protein